MIVVAWCRQKLPRIRVKLLSHIYLIRQLIRIPPNTEEAKFLSPHNISVDSLHFCLPLRTAEPSPLSHVPLLSLPPCFSSTSRASLDQVIERTHSYQRLSVHTIKDIETTARPGSPPPLSIPVCQVRPFLVTANPTLLFLSVGSLLSSSIQGSPPSISM